FGGDFLRGWAGGVGATGGFGFFPAVRAAANFSQSARFGGACPAGFTLWSAFSCPFNWRNENGRLSCGATKSVSTKRTVPRKIAMPAINKTRRNRGQRLPPGSEKTNGAILGSSSICGSLFYLIPAN